jgi:copper transport protein
VPQQTAAGEGVTGSVLLGHARRLTGLLVLLALLSVQMLSMAAPASAHAALVGSEPGAGYAITSPPREIVLQFSEGVSLAADALTLTGPDGQGVPVRVAVDPSGTSVSGTPTEELSAGAYEVGYRVVARDGDLIAGSYPFGIATP